MLLKLDYFYDSMFHEWFCYSHRYLSLLLQLRKRLGEKVEKVSFFFII